MDDLTMSGRIEALVAEEHELLDAAPEGDDAERRARLEAVRVELDQCWDLLRQRRAREEFGLDPDEASPRAEETVEGYRQ